MTKKSATESAAPKFEKTLTIIVNEQPQTIKMTFGLLTELAATMTGLEDAQMLMLDNDRLTDFLNLVLATRDAEGNIEEGSVDLRVGDALDMEDYEKLVTWSTGHVMSFFVRRARSLSLAGKTLQPELEALNKLTTG